jgi:hypothetical protein
MELRAPFIDVRPLLRLALIVVAAAIAISALGPGRASAASGPLVNSKFADRPVKPTSFSPSNIASLSPGGQTFNDFVRGIEWTTWGGAEAEGVGRVSLLRSDGSTSPVKVFLSSPERCAGIRVYTEYHLLLAPGAAKPKGQAGRFPCRLSSGTYSGQRLGRTAPCAAGLFLPGPSPEARLRIAPWQPRPPGGRWSLCQLRIGNWGQQQANGTGVVRRLGGGSGQREWTVRIWLSRPIWCPRVGEGIGGAITYGKLRIKLLGGVADTGQRRGFAQEIGPPTSRCRLARAEGA